MSYADEDQLLLFYPLIEAVRRCCDMIPEGTMALNTSPGSELVETARKLLETENASLQPQTTNHLKELTTENVRLQTEDDDLLVMNGRLMGQLAEVIASQQEAEMKCRRLQTMNASLQAQIASLQEAEMAHSGVALEIASRQEAQTEMVSRYRAEMASRQEAQMENARLQKQIDGQLEMIDSLKGQLAEAYDSPQEAVVRAQLEMIGRLKGRLAEAIASQQEADVRAQVQIARLQEEIARLQEENTFYKSPEYDPEGGALVEGLVDDLGAMTAMYEQETVRVSALKNEVKILREHLTVAITRLDEQTSAVTHTAVPNRGKRLEQKSAVAYTPVSMDQKSGITQEDMWKPCYWGKVFTMCKKSGMPRADHIGFEQVTHLAQNTELVDAVRAYAPDWYKALKGGKKYQDWIVSPQGGAGIKDRLP